MRPVLSSQPQFFQNAQELSKRGLPFPWKAPGLLKGEGLTGQQTLRVLFPVSPSALSRGCFSVAQTYQNRPGIYLHALFLSFVIKFIQNPNHNHLAPEASAVHLCAHSEQGRKDSQVQKGGEPQDRTVRTLRTSPALLPYELPLGPSRWAALWLKHLACLRIS